MEPFNGNTKCKWQKDGCADIGNINEDSIDATHSLIGRAATAVAVKLKKKQPTERAKQGIEWST